MIYELRIYQPMPNKIDVISQRFEKYTLAIYKKHGIVPVGFFKEDIGQQGRFVDILGWESMAHRDKQRPAFFADPEWRAIREKSEREDGPTTAHIHNSILIPYPYSPMK